MKYPVPAVCAVVIRSGNEVLLLGTGEGWRLPGEVLPGGEDWMGGMGNVVRKLTGLTVRAAKLTGIYSDPALCLFEREGGPIHFLDACFLVTVTEGELLGGDRLRFWPLEALPELRRGEAQKIADARAFKGETFVR